MFKEEIIQLFDNQLIVSSTDIHAIDVKKRESINTEVKRMSDKHEIYRIGKGLYIKPQKTKWGMVLPNEKEIAYQYYCNNNSGYITDVSYLNKIGITTLVSNKTFLASNKYRYKLYNMKHTIIKRPKITINKENALYLQLLDGINAFFVNHCDATNPEIIFINEIIRLKLDIAYIIIMAKRYYSSKVLQYVLKLGGIIYDDITYK